MRVGGWERKVGLRLLKRAFRATKGGVMITDATAVDDPIVYVNRAFERITGYASEEAIGRNPRFLQADDSDQPALDELRAARKARNDDIGWAGTLRNYRKDGTLFYSELSASAVRDEEGRVTHHVGVISDVTDREKAEEALRKSEAMLAQAQRLARLGSWEWDVKTGETAWSDETYRILGYAPRGVAPTFERFFGAVHPDDRGMLGDAVDAALGEGYDIEHRLVLPDGGVRVVHCRGEVAFDEAGEPLRMVGTVHDVTERKEAELALKEAEEGYRRRARELSLLHEVRSAAAGELGLGSVFRAVVEAVAESYGYVQVSAYLLEGTAEDGVLVLQHQVGYETIIERIPTSQGVSGRVVRTGEPVLLEDVSEDPAFLGAIEGITSEVCVPLFDEGHVVGTLNVESTGGRVLEEDDLRLTESVAEHIGVAVGRAALHERIKGSEQRFRALTEAALEGILITEGGVILEANRAYAEILGYDLSEMVGRPVLDFTAPESVELVREKIASGTEEVYEAVAYKKDGTRLCIEIRGRPSTYRGRAVRVTAIRDVTERKEAEEERLRVSREYEEMIRVLPNVVFRCGRAEDGGMRLTYSEGALAQEFGVDTGRAAGRPLGELFPPEFLSTVVPAFERAFAGETVGFPSRIGDRSFANVAMPFRAGAEGREGRAHADEIVGYVTEVTERERAEEALRRSEERFRALVQNSSDVVTVLDADGTIRYQSLAVERVMGYAPEELVGGDVFGHVHPDDVQRTRDALAESLRSPENPVHVEFRFRHKDGSWRHLEAIGNNLLSDPAVGGVVVNSRDVTARKRAEEALRKSNDLLSAVMEGTTDAVFVKDLEGRYLMINGAGAEALGKTIEEVLGKTDAELFAAADGREVVETDREIMASGDVRTIEDTKTTEEGATRTFLATKGPYTNARGDVVGLFGVSRDITERKALEDRMEHQAFHDPLTGLANRALLMDRLGHALARARRRGGTVAVSFLDLDNFKYVNDSLGHEMGDKLLVEAARRLEGCVRPGDTVARLGGDEFAVLLEEVGGVGEATRVAERAVEALKEPFDLGGREVFCGTSVGVALGEAGRDLPEDLLRKADLALYEAKHEGKARYAVFDPEAERRSMRRLELENGLRRALERDEFRVCYQPVVSLETGRPIGFEALVRWEHPERGLVLPDEFVPLAEETGLIVPVGERVLREACGQTKTWQESHPSDPPLVVGVNLSAKQLSHPDLVGDVEEILRETGLDPGRLTLEVTESALVEDDERHAGTLRELRDLGVRFAIDDFGTGYSSLSYLKRLPAGLLKLDGSFVGGIGRGAKEDEVLLSGVVGIAHGLGLLVCAEGVETPEQASWLRELGCDLAQGRHFSGPLTVEAASRLLAGAREDERPV